MKIKNKYVFRSIISEFLYFKKKKTHESSVAARPRHLGMPDLGILGLTCPNALGLA
jgi:hypothetical protein